MFIENHQNYLSEAPHSSLKGKKVLLRLDLNVPIKDNTILDYTRIERSINTIKHILASEDVKLIIISHLGRPKGYDQSVSLEPICKAFSRYGLEILFDSSNITQDLTALNQSINANKVVMLENLRFYSGEEVNDADFAKTLASLADVYVNDAFSVSHRCHASVDAISKLFKQKYFGINFQHEVEALDKVTSQNSSDYTKTVIIAGKKVSTKFKALKALSQNVDYLVIAGAMANTFLAANARNNLGASYVEHNMIAEIKEFINQPHKAQIILPNDFVTIKGMDDNKTSIKKLEDMQNNDIALDIGPSSVQQIKDVLSKSNLLLWNGPLGYYEDSRFIGSTYEVAQHIGHLTKQGALKSIAGGGDIVAALFQLKMLEEFSYISTAGGALLDYIVEQG